MIPTIIVQRAKILLFKADGRSNESVADELGIDKRTVLLWPRKYRNRSANETLNNILSVSGAGILKRKSSVRPKLG